MSKAWVYFFLFSLTSCIWINAEPVPTNNISAQDLPDVLLGYFDYSNAKKINYNSRSDNEIDYVISRLDKKSGGLIELQRLASRKYRFYNFPQISPDNHRLLYLSEKGIHVLDLKTLKQIILPSINKKVDTTPVWSSDGNKIAYKSFEKTEYSESGWEIVIVDADGKNKKTFKSKPVDSEHYPIAWSPDGKKIAYTSWGSDEEGPSQVFVLNLENNHEYQITKATDYGFSPTWSPDSKKVAYISKGEELYISDYDGKNQKKLTKTYFDSLCRASNAKLNDKPQWSPDGLQILFETAKNCQYDLYTIDLSKNLSKKLSSPVHDWDYQAKWSARGKFIFFLFGIQLYVIDSQTNKQALIKSHAVYNDLNNFSLVKAIK